MLERHWNYRSAQLACLGEHFTGRVANEPGAMAVCVQPIDFKTGAIFLSGPTATAPEVNCALSCRAEMPFGSDFRLDRPCRQEWHLGSDRGGRRCLLERQFGQRSMLAADYLWLRRHCDRPYAAHR